MDAPVVDLSALAQGQAARLSRIDRYLPVPAVIAPSDGGVVLTATAGPSVAAGQARTINVDPADFFATFSALTAHSLTVQADGPDPASAVDELIRTWREHLYARYGLTEADSAATVTLASRDTSIIPAMVAHGFSPSSVLALRRGTTPPTAPAADELQIRAARPADLESVVALQMEALRFDAQLGVGRIRESTEATVRRSLFESLARGDGTRMLAELDGAAVGLVIVDLPEHATWVAHLISRAPVAYLECLSVSQQARSGGIGSALVAAAHRRIEDSDGAVTVLHHALANPLSAPFWAFQGYRPLWTSWVAEPLSTLR